MKTLLLLFAAACAHGQILSGIVTGNGIPSAPTITFSPAAGAVTNPTTVTMSTPGGTCDAYIYHNTTGSVTTGDVHTATYSVTSAVTLYAAVIGCPGFSNSTGNAAYTLSVPPTSISLVALLTGSDSSGGLVASMDTTACTGSACTGTNVNILAGDLLYAVYDSYGGSSYTNTNPGITFRDSASINSLSTIAWVRDAAALYGLPSATYAWGSASAASNVSFHEDTASDGGQIFTAMRVFVFRPSSAVTSWALGTNHAEAFVDINSLTSVTSGSLGNAVQYDFIVSSMMTRNSTTISLGTCGDGGCTSAYTDSFRRAEFKYQAGATTAATASYTITTGGGGAAVLAARFTPSY